MEIPKARKWMYQRLDANKHLTEEFREGVYEFLQYVIGQEKFQEQGEVLRCPCVKCNCKVFKYVDQVVWDLYQKGFMPNYYRWTNHGEDQPAQSTLDQHWSSIEFQNKSVIAKANRVIDKGESVYCVGSISTASHCEKMSKEFERQPTTWKVVERTKKLRTEQWVNDKTSELAEKYKKCQEVEQHLMLEGSSSQNSPVTSIDDNKTYFNVVECGNKKRNVYDLNVLSKRCNTSTSVHSTPSQATIVHQIEEMREAIQKLNDKLMEKNAKERILEEKMEQLMKDQQKHSERIRQQGEKMKLILQ